VDAQDYQMKLLQLSCFAFLLIDQFIVHFAFVQSLSSCSKRNVDSLLAGMEPAFVVLRMIALLSWHGANIKPTKRKKII